MLGQVRGVLDNTVSAIIISSDSATRGLDSSTALEFIQALRTATDMCNLSTIVRNFLNSDFCVVANVL